MKKENPNNGHRERLRQKYIENGINSFEEHEILELMLFSVISRGNTNHTGHYLIDGCGGIDHVFAADKARLMEIDGVGEATADFITFQKDMFSVYDRCRRQEKGPRFTQENGMTLVKSLFDDEPNVRQLYMILLGNENRIIAAELIARGNIDYSDISMRDIVSRAIRLNAFRVIFAHNHTNGNVMPSDGDIMFTKRADKVLAFADIEMNDHIVVTGATAVSIRNDMRVLDKSDRI